MTELKWLKYQDNVKKTPAITRAVELLDPYFENEPSEVSSGFRGISDQTRIIFEKAKRHGVLAEFPEFTEAIIADPKRLESVGDIWLFGWQRSWSKLLSIGDIVNPPVPATCLFDYMRPGGTENKKGQIIGISNHQRGLSLDIKGGTNLIEKAKRVMKAKQEGNCFIVNFLVEHVNNAVHIDVAQIG